MTFNTMKMKFGIVLENEVLNLVINGWPSIPQIKTGGKYDNKY